MAAHETRLLVLGAVALFEPVNGYQIRRELLSWQVERWAHVNPGSIYHALGRLTDEGHVTRHDLPDGGREVAVYEVTGPGRAELERMLVAGLEEADPFDRVAFHAAFSMLPLLELDRVVAALTARRVGLEDFVREAARGADDPAYGPPHARRVQLLWLDLTTAELAWLRETIEELRSGRLKFAPGQDWDWTPPDDDPGWQMNLDRAKYAALLAGRDR